MGHVLVLVQVDGKCMDRELIIIINYLRGGSIKVDVVKLSERWL
jgi:hypothetical protein